MDDIVNEAPPTEAVRIVTLNGRNIPDFRFTASNIHRAGVNIKVEEITGWGDDGTYDFDPYLTCLIKWDSCCHFYFGETLDETAHGYIHMCGVHDLMKHAHVMRELYVWAFQLMGREPSDGEEWA